MSDSSGQAALQRAVELPFLLLFGGTLYYLAEVLWRGRSHWSMAVCGAVCFLFIYRLNQKYPRVPAVLRALAGGLFITLQELLFGCLFNLALDMHVWDYSHVPLHLWGQICLPYSLLWCLLCLGLGPVTRTIRRRVFYCAD